MIANDVALPASELTPMNHEDEVYEIKVTLVDIYPSIWRRLLVPGEIMLGNLHEVLQAAWWQNSIFMIRVRDRVFWKL